MSEKCFQITVKGNVQGVFFRKYTRIMANNLGIKGFVRNEPDTSVYIEACGEAGAIEKFIQWCHHGPEHAAVEKVDVQEISLKKFSTFDIVFF
ncbi:MAG TPA: acylphosphatase [Bacteroidia bacterium]|nr:acylphosphatase [Bacteroidia bacterium]